MSLLNSRLAGPIAAGVAVALFITLSATSLANHYEKKSLNVQIASLTQTLEKTKTHLAQARTNAATLDQAISNQNAAIDQLKAEAQLFEAHWKAGEAARAKLIQEAKQKSDAILTSPLDGATQLDRFIQVDDLLMESIR